MALKKEKIIQEALQLLNESGLEGVTLRKLASRLNVQAPALYWHFKNKKTLVNEMAEAILQTEFYDITERRADESWQDRSEEHTSELQSRGHLVCRLLLAKKKR